ncbi:MAG: alkylated DNA repair dioxygenase [Hyphomicrobiales bacterium]|nr:MAG: alkylated DNA repair dioxygenase [Hyphomicrobiales bacterium]
MNVSHPQNGFTNTLIELAPGIDLYPQFFELQAQKTLVDLVRDIVRQAPLFQPTMPKTGKAFSVKMSNCGSLGWVADKTGYRYQANHPTTAKPWPPIPQMLDDVWTKLTSNEAGKAQACLINYYDPSAKMGLHQDRDEQNLQAPVVSISLGDDCRFRIGGLTRSGPTQSLTLHSGDVLVLGGENRLAFHGVERIYPGTSTLLSAPGRINLTLRRVTG